MRSIGNVDVDVVRAEYSAIPREAVDVCALVVSKLNKMARDIDATVASHVRTLGPPDSVTLHESSILDVELPERSVHHVITSPPYGVEAISYLRTHLLSYRSLVAELKHDPYETRDKTIGGEYLPDDTQKHSYVAAEASKKFKKFFAVHDDAETADSKLVSRRIAMMQFFDDMVTVGERLSRSLVNGGHLAFIIGNKRLGERVIPTDEIIIECFEAAGLTFESEIRHKLKTNNSNSQVPWQERIIQEEAILLFRRNARRR
jgi:hypothetical protein